MEPDVLLISIRDKSDLYAAYMPFVENGGFFLPTTRECRIDDPVLVMIRRGETG